ncbi:MAG TPA: glycosyltransferase family 4 protein [Vicinamibacterales bacterium]|nr:glycosyltransferase family 4 protein [Vicinamibacterales bacterium]
MAVLAIVTSSPEVGNSWEITQGARNLVEGGHLVVARSLVQAAREAGHDAHLVVTPDYGFGRLRASYWANWRANVTTIEGQRIDQVISLRYPSFAVRHGAHVCWLNHTMREYYDLWPRFVASISWRNQIKESIRRAILHGTDRWLLKSRVTRVVAQSATIQSRLVRDFNLHTDVLHPPAPPRRYRCDRYDNYIFAVSRLTPLKRVDLLIRALAEPPAGRVRAVVAGEGESRSDLEALAKTLGVADRIEFLGATNEATLIDHLSRCRAVAFTPIAEDYGLVAAEAFASRKAVVTCSDSGGPTELVRDGETGLVTESTPRALAGALERLSGDVSLAERLGANAAAVSSTMSWATTVSRLLIV